MANPKYKGEWLDFRNNLWRIDIYDKEDPSTGTPASVIARFHGAPTLNYEGDETNICNTIIPASLEFSPMVEDDDLETFLNSVNSSYEGKYLAYLYLNNDFYWGGIILPDLSGKKNAPKPYAAALTATDGFMKLKDIDYDNDGTLYTGRASFINHLKFVLGKLGVRDYLPADQFLLCVITDWYEDSMVANQDPLVISDLDHENFQYIDDVGTKRGMNCYQVLEELVRRWNARIIQEYGYFKIIQFGELVKTGTTLIWTRYYHATGSTYVNVYASSLLSSAFQTLSGGYYKYLQPFREVTVKYKYKESVAQNLLTDNTPVIYPVPDNLSLPTIPGAGGEQISFDGIVKAEYDQDAGAPFAHKVHISIYLTIACLGVGSKYLTNKNGYNEWSDTNTDRWEMDSIMQMKRHYTLLIPVSFITPEVPAEGTGTFSCTIKLYDSDDNDITGDIPADATFSSSAINFVLKMLYSDGTLGEGSILFKVTNTTDGTTPVMSTCKKELTDIITGDKPKPFSLGRLKAYNGVAWSNSDIWKIANTGTGYDINQLLLREILALQRIPKESYQGMLKITTGHISACKLLNIDSSNYMMLRGRLNMVSDEWDGVWVKMTIDRTNILDATPAYTTDSNDSGSGSSGNSNNELLNGVSDYRQGVLALTAGVWSTITFDKSFDNGNYTLTPLQSMTDIFEVMQLRIKDITATGFKVWAAKNSTYRWLAIKST